MMWFFLVMAFATVGAAIHEGRHYDGSGKSAALVVLFAVLAVTNGAAAGHRWAYDRIRAAGYAVEFVDGNRAKPRIGIAPTPQPTRVRWLATPAPTAGAGD